MNSTLRSPEEMIDYAQEAYELTPENASSLIKALFVMVAHQEFDAPPADLPREKQAQTAMIVDDYLDKLSPQGIEQLLTIQQQAHQIADEGGEKLEKIQMMSALLDNYRSSFRGLGCSRAELDEKCHSYAVRLMDMPEDELKKLHAVKFKKPQSFK